MRFGAARRLLKQWLPRSVADRLRFAPWRLKKYRYSFEGEDILAGFLLAEHVTGRVGRYVDVGSNHPMHNSNTFMFYRQGWRGLCVDPTPGFAKDFARLRPRDRFIEAGVGPDGVMDFYRFSESQYNTFSPQLAERHRQDGHAGQSPIRVPIRPLMSLLDEASIPPESVDLFSLDVEGHEMAVLSGIDWTRFTPHVVIAEVFAASVADLLNDPVNLFLEGAGYVAASKLHNSAIYVRRPRVTT